MDVVAEGALTVKKDPSKEKHDQIEGVPNLHVMQVMKSLESRGYVRLVYNWRWYYYFLTDDGIEFLRNYLHLPSEIQPATLMKPTTKAARPGDERQEGGRGGGFGRGEKGASGEFRPKFGGGDYRRGGGIGRGA